MGLAVESARVFSASKTIENPALNALGVQVFRTLAARAIYGARRSPAAGSDEDAARVVRAEGITAVPRFLEEERFARIVAEADDVFSMHQGKVHQHGGTHLSLYDLRELDSKEFPELCQWRENERCLRLVEAVEKRQLTSRDGLRVLERVVYEDDTIADPETQLHVDTFFNTHKVWLYLDEVHVEHGPLTYVPRSHRLSAVRLARDYSESRGGRAGSRRIPEVEVERRGLSRRQMTVRANTLVVANTHGYHCRAQGRPGQVRRALHMSFRFNPFMPRSLRIDDRLRSGNSSLARAIRRARAPRSNDS
jgi:hypothetical protein